MRENFSSVGQKILRWQPVSWRTLGALRLIVRHTTFATQSTERTQSLFTAAPVVSTLPQALIFFLHFVEDKLISLKWYCTLFNDSPSKIKQNFSWSLASGEVLDLYSWLFHVLKCVADRPQAVLSLGPTLDPLRIKEGDDVYFECVIKAKPDIYKTTWWFNVSRNRVDWDPLREKIRNNLSTWEWKESIH